MKNFKKYVSVSLIMIFSILFFMAMSVNASSLQLTPTNNTTNNTVPLTANNTANITSNITNNNTTNVTKVDNINENLPKTGENDVYVISAIGAIAIVVGGIAFAKSKKYDVR